MTSSETPSSDPGSQGEGQNEEFTVRRLHEEFISREDVFKDGGKGPVPGAKAGLYFGRYAEGWDLEKLKAWIRVRRRGGRMSTKTGYPVGKAARWYEDVLRADLAQSALDVAREIARLCGDQTQVSIGIHSLADAVGVVDRRFRSVNWTQSGIKTLVRHGWLKKISGVGRKGRSTFYLTRPPT